MKARIGVRRVFVLGALAVAGLARSAAAQSAPDQEPGVAAVHSARLAIARVAAEAAHPTSTTAALGSVLLGLAKPGAPEPPVRGQSVDSAAQPFFQVIEPELERLRDEILDRRHRFLTGEDRVREERAPELVLRTFDVRSITGAWRDFELTAREPGPTPAIMDGAFHSLGIYVDPDKLRDIIDSRLGGAADEGGSVEISGGTLFVRKSAEAVAKVEALLEEFRVATGRRLAIDVAAYRLPREVVLEHAGQATPAEAAAALERAVAAGKATLLASRSAIVADGGVARFVSTGKRAFLGEESVSQTGVVPVVDPVVSRLDLGLKGDVRASSAPGRPEVIVDLDLAFRELKEVALQKLGDRQLELPATLVTRHATTLLLPLGHAAFVGGTLASGEDAASSCAFLVRVSRYAERVRPAHPVEAVPAAPAPARAANVSARREVRELDALLEIVEAALASVHEARRHVLRLFDVRDLLEAQASRTAPVLGVVHHRSIVGKKSEEGGQHGGGMTGGVLTFGGSESDRFGGGYEGAVVLEPEKLESLVKHATGADASWADPASYELHVGELVVNQTPGMLAKIDALLEEVRRGRTGNVEIEATWYHVDDALLAEVSRDGPALSREALARLEAAAAAGERATCVASGFTVARRGDATVIYGGAETTFVDGFEHASGGTGTVVQTVGVPLPSFIRQGLTLEALGRGDIDGAEGTLTVGARLGLLKAKELPAVPTPSGPVTTPVLDEAETAFEGVAPGGAVLLVVGRRAGEKRPAVVATLRAHTLR